MMILERILQEKQREVECLRRTDRLAQLRRAYEARTPQWKRKRPFAESLAAPSAVPHLIAELKKASPSKGLIRADFSVTELAAAYERGGATALSVLTDEPFFQGSPDYLAEVRQTVGLPLLRKDFILSAEQVEESLYLGADAILLIAAAMHADDLIRLRRLAGELQLDVLIEVHNEQELEMALAAQPDLIGINNRDLRTFHTDLAVTDRLAPLVPASVPLISESGIQSHDDLQRLASMGVRAVLVGESLMRQTDVAEAVERLLGRIPS